MALSALSEPAGSSASTSLSASVNVTARAASATSTSSPSASSASPPPSGRPLLGYRLTPSSASLLCPYHLLDVDVVDKSGVDVEYRRQKVAQYEGVREVLDGTFQAQAAQRSVATQTAHRQSRSAISQYQRQTMGEEAMEEAMRSDGLRLFVERVWPELRRELSKNEALDVFKDQLRLEEEDEEEPAAAALGATSGRLRPNTTAGGSLTGSGASSTSASTGRPSHALSLFHSFHHLLYSRSASVGWVEWHPSRCCIAFSLIPSWTFDEWCDHSGEVSLSYILLYDLNNLLQPYTIIKVPGVVTVFRFHPTQHLHTPRHSSGLSASSPSSSTSVTPLVAGLQTGQVLLYHLPNLPTTAQESKAAAGQPRPVTAQPKPLPPNPLLSAPFAPLPSPSSSASSASSASSSSSSFLSSLSSSPSDGSSLVPSPLYALLSNLDRSHGRPITDLHFIPLQHNVNRRGERIHHNHSNVTASTLLSSQLLSFAADGKVLFWDYRQLNEPSHSSGGGHLGPHSTSSAAASHAGDDGLTSEEWHEKRDGKWSPLYSLPLHLAQPSSGGDADGGGGGGGAGGASSSSAPSMNSLVRVSTAFPVSSTLTARRVAPGPSPLSALLLAVSEDGELLEIDTAARGSPDGHSQPHNSASSSSSSTSSSASSLPPSVLRRCRVHSTVGVSIDRSPCLPSLYVSCGESTWSIWHCGDDQPVFVSPPCQAQASYSAARWSPSRPAVVCLGRSDGVVEVWDCCDQTHSPSITFPTGSSDAVMALQFQPANVHLVAPAIDPAAPTTSTSSATPAQSSPHPVLAAPSSVAVPSVYSSSARQYLAAGDGGGKCHIIEVPRPLRRKLAGEDALMLRWIERERSRGHCTQLRQTQKSRGQSTLTPYQQQMQAMPELFAQHQPSAQQQTQLTGEGLEQTEPLPTSSSSSPSFSSPSQSVAADAGAETEYATSTSALLASLAASLKSMEAGAA